MTFEVAGEAYDRFMGRYSRPLAGRAGRLARGVRRGSGPSTSGCGPGALTGHLVERLGADQVAAVDPSPPFVEACRARFPGVDVRQGDRRGAAVRRRLLRRRRLLPRRPLHAGPGRRLAEMARVTRDGGWVGATVWDLHGRREPMAPIWAALAEVDPDHPGEGRSRAARRASSCEILEGAGLRDVEGTEMAVTLTHPTLRGVVGALPPRRRARWARPSRALGPGPARAAARHLPRTARRRAPSTSRRSPSRPAAAPERRTPPPTSCRRRQSVSRRGDREAAAGGPGYAGPIMTRSLLLRCRSEA